MSTTRSAVPVIAMVLAVALAGCGAVDELARHLESGVAAAPPAPKAKPKRVVPPAPRPKPKIALAARLEDRPTASRELDPEMLIGLIPAQALAALGNPTAVHERSPSMVWRYDAKDCAIDLFFYMDLGANVFRVLAYEMKAGASSDGAARACLGRVRAAADGR